MRNYLFRAISLFPQCFLLFRRTFRIQIQSKIVVCKLFQFGKSLKFGGKEKVNSLSNNPAEEKDFLKHCRKGRTYCLSTDKQRLPPFPQCLLLAQRENLLLELNLLTSLNVLDPN